MVERARAAQTGWQALGFEGRAKVLRRTQKWVLDNSDRFLDTLVAETGKTREDAVLAELGYAAGAFGFWAKNASKYLADEKIKPRSPFLLGRKVFVRYEAVGVVGVIGPWNYPFTKGVGDAIPALAAGNAVIDKPSSVTPLTALLMEEGLRECGLPDDVFQVLVGRGPIGLTLIDQVDIVMFTGSTETGKKVMERAAKTLTPVSLELGGKDPMIVLADADLERAANAAVFWSMQNSGQTCISVERVYVEEPIYDEFVALRGRARAGAAPGRARRLRVGRRRLVHQSAADRDRARRTSRTRSRRARACSRAAPATGDGRVLRAHRARRRRPHDGVHDRGDVRADAADHEGPPTPTRRSGWRTTRRTACRRRSSPRTSPRARRWRARIEAGAVVVNDCERQLHRARGADGRLEDVGPGRPPRRRRDPQVHRRQTIVLTRFAMKKDLYFFPYKAGKSKFLLRLLKLIYGRGNRD